MKISNRMPCAIVNRVIAVVTCTVLAWATPAALGTTGCPGDATGDGVTNVDDILTMLAQWGPGEGHSGDVNGNGEVGADDILVALSHYQNCNATAVPAWQGSTVRYLEMELVTSAPPPFGGGATKVYRLMAHMEPHGRIDAAYAYGSAGITISPVAGSTFYQDGAGGATSQSINNDFFPFVPSMEWDSYVTIGALYSNGFPYDSNALNNVGVDWNNFENGHSLTATNGCWFVMPDEAQNLELGGKICLGQFTVSSGTGVGHHDVTGKISLHGFNSNGQYWTHDNIGWVVHTVCSTGCDYSSIQAAVNAASTGDTVLVKAGTYAEHGLNPGGKAITIIGELDPSGAYLSKVTRTEGGPVVVCENAETAATVFRDLDIYGGNAVNGGGIVTNGASPTFQHCLVGPNSASGNGGGMYNHGGSPTLNDCTFQDNTAVGMGGGIYNLDGSPVLNHTTVSHNTASSGGGVVNAATRNRGGTDELSHPTLNNCTVCGNTGGQVVGSAHHAGDISHIHTNCNIDQDPGDLDNDGDVDLDDRWALNYLLGLCHEDVNGTYSVDIDDLLLVIESWNDADCEVTP